MIQSVIIVEKTSGQSGTYLEPSEKSKMEHFSKVVGCFCKALHIRCFTGYEYASDEPKQNAGMLPFISQKIRSEISASLFHF